MLIDWVALNRAIEIIGRAKAFNARILAFGGSLTLQARPVADDVNAIFIAAALKILGLATRLALTHLRRLIALGRLLGHADLGHHRAILHLRYVHTHLPHFLHLLRRNFRHVFHRVGLDGDFP